jgi:hypothetical protein
MTFGYPILLDGKKALAFIISPTSTIHSKTNSVMSTERSEMFSLMVGIIAAVMMMVLLQGGLNSIFPNNPDSCRSW